VERKIGGARIERRRVAVGGKHRPWLGIRPSGQDGDRLPDVGSDKSAIDPGCIGPCEADRLLGRRVRGESVAERASPNVYRTPRDPQRFLRLQHHGEFRKIEAADMN
jgi:hypothetical protein